MQSTYGNINITISFIVFTHCCSLAIYHLPFVVLSASILSQVCKYSKHAHIDYTKTTHITL